MYRNFEWSVFVNDRNQFLGIIRRWESGLYRCYKQPHSKPNFSLEHIGLEVSSNKKLDAADSNNVRLIAGKCLPQHKPAK